MIFGDATLGGTAFTLAANTKFAHSYTAPAFGMVSKLTFAVDGGGSGIGTQALRGVFYTGGIDEFMLPSPSLYPATDLYPGHEIANDLLAVSDEVLVDDGDPLGWLDFSFLSQAPEGISVARGVVYQIGLISGTTASIARVFGSSAMTAHSNSDTYADGPSDPFGVATTSHHIGGFATVSPDYVPSPNVDDIYRARLGFPDAQLALSGPLIRRSARRASLGWHGTLVDPERGSFVAVQQGGEFSDLVGERIKLSYRRHSVFAYVHQELDIPEDLSLTRRLFAALAPLATDELDATVEIVAEAT